ncbi:rhamnosyltransferase [Candidatus Symbiobacter mobilis CR]|uniref:Rhamnosyltransferase n=2 Tax=Candidatus Symbiobacter TaxID=1436289 RepID=U5NAN8_9BURK|nr:rhamnosyltransferase [Candidatus Symbiobacter mobilis CR]
MGGVEQVIHQLARGISTLGINTHVLSLTSGRELKTIKIEGYFVHRAQCHFYVASTGFSATVFHHFTQLSKDVDIIHYHYPWPLMDLVHFVTRVKKPTVVTYHADIVRQKHLFNIYRPLQERFLNSVDKIIATSSNYYASSPVLQKFAQKVSVIPIGLDKATYPEPSVEKVKYWHQRFGSKFFLFVGVLRHYKGLHTLLKASENVEFPVVIVGNGPLEKSLKHHAMKLGLSQVHFLGYLSNEDKVALLTLCYGIVFPSHLRSEAFGITLLEGAMFGKPMISSEIGTGTTSINIAGETGLVVPPADHHALKQAMLYLWQHPDEAIAMGKRSKTKYQTHFTADRMVKSYIDIYNQLLTA